MMRQEPISPYVIQLYDWFEHPRKFTLIMEFPEPCESLLDFITRNPQLDETTARVLMRQAVLAVKHCIERGVFHNDVHAQNFLLRKNMLELKLIDFGSGHLLSADGYESDIYVGEHFWSVET
jgi:serine/threonine protein kinase